MVVDRARGEEETLGDLRVPQSLRDESEHLELPRRQLRGVGPGRPARPARDVACADLAEASRDHGSEGCGAHALELGQRLAQRLLVLRLRKGERRLVRTSDCTPRRSRSMPVAREVERPGLVDAVGQVVDDPALAAPVGELSEPPGPWCLALAAKDRVGRLRDVVASPFQPRDLRLCAGERCVPARVG